jgi:gliding motility-associated-like protein
VAGVGLTASPDTIFFAGDHIDLMAIPMNSNDSVIAWIPNSILDNTNTFSNNITPSSTIWVGVQTINQAGCKAIDSIRLVKIDVEVPNAFTPNGDNQNDIFLLRGSGLDAVQSIEIFNRWGERVFYSNDPLVGWDGRYLGNMQQVETYTYQIQLKNKNSKKVRTVRGNLLLIL